MTPATPILPPVLLNHIVPALPFSCLPLPVGVSCGILGHSGRTGPFTFPCPVCIHYLPCCAQLLYLYSGAIAFICPFVVLVCYEHWADDIYITTFPCLCPCVHHTCLSGSCVHYADVLPLVPFWMPQVHSPFIACYVVCCHLLACAAAFPLPATTDFYRIAD